MAPLLDALKFWPAEYQFVAAVVAAIVAVVLVVIGGAWLLAGLRTIADLIVGAIHGWPETEKTNVRKPGHCPNTDNFTGRCLHPHHDCRTAGECRRTIDLVGRGGEELISVKLPLPPGRDWRAEAARLRDAARYEAGTVTSAEVMVPAGPVNGPPPPPPPPVGDGLYE